MADWCKCDCRDPTDDLTQASTHKSSPYDEDLETEPAMLKEEPGDTQNRADERLFTGNDGSSLPPLSLPVFTTPSPPYTPAPPPATEAPQAPPLMLPTPVSPPASPPSAPQPETKAPEALDSAPKVQLAPAMPAGCLQMRFDVQPNSNPGLTFVDANASAASVVVTVVADASPFKATVSHGAGMFPGDQILAVNGVRGDVQVQLAKACARGGEVELLLQPRPPTLHIEVRKNPNSLERMGVVAAVHDDDKHSIRVREICDEGAVPRYNEQHPTALLCPNDLIVGVNGQSREALSMVRTMQTTWEKCEPLKFTVMTHPSEEVRPR
mmetsp:Transcript_19215/g.41869  ORF Transcript_19215/g.41869 Transcript_19215/m.41869 type:complete len:324 (-) Transcript_19215:394-1365(-)|eukprot:CAMPEP_0170592792 /NCGR_PEP_ID=MMETSP0224-20130122/13108_1 /TAXON_ID=285029 /ORGANISM="Togula jolla, Strain CCCM 725" /LENGTH=323 /DNA_ID=CAMNT_0010916711 /DNA_START=58 /DNA_END=1029 /DNA_ORIENTATION=+